MNIKTEHIVLIVAVVIIALLVIFSGGSSLMDTGVGEDDLMEETSAPLSVSGQSAGNSVSIDSLKLTAEKTWVAIHEDSEGAPGNILGAKRFRPEDASGTILLLRNTEAGKTYHAMLHTDDGDDIFDQNKDMPTLENNTPVMVSFSTRAAQ